MAAMKPIIMQQNVRRGRPSRFFWFGRSGHGGGGSRRNGPDMRRLLSYALWIGTVLVLAGSVAVIVLFIWLSRLLPDPNNIIDRSIPQTTKIYDRTGETILYEVYGPEKRTIVELDAIAPAMIDATIAGEDPDFYTHRGFKLRAYLRAFFANIRTGERSQGGSTITQQFVKNALLSPEKTYTRKVKELVLSLEMERRFSKEEILKLYLNEIPYGPVIYGVESAAESFFGKKASELTLSESATIAAVANATTYYSPYGSHTDELMERAHWIIDQMVEAGTATPEAAEEAKADDVLARLKPQRASIIAPHFVFYVRELLAEEFGESVVERGGLKVITTLDLEKQEVAETTIDENIEVINDRGGNTAALLSLDARNGDILAMVGSADYFNEEINGNYNALLGKLQPGSSIKPIVYAASFERGLTPDTVFYDVITEFSDGVSYKPQNYDNKEHGPLTVREALGASYNIPAVKALYITGLSYFAEFATRFGYSTLSDTSKYGLSLVLGGAEVIPLEHIAAFTTLAQDGIAREPRAILRVEDIDGKELFKAEEQPRGRRIIDKEIARQINDILSDNAARSVTFGEHNLLTIGDRPVAAKTGTTNLNKDAWTIGYTPTFVTGVWVGNADGSLMRPGAGGSMLAAPIWNTYMRTVLSGSAYEQFPEPLPVVTGKPVLDGDKSAQTKVRIDTVTGKLATAFTPEELVEERGFGIPHSILFFVDPADIRGPMPTQPENDPQFARWESAVAEWVTKQNGGVLPISTDPPPTEYDDVHVPENIPIVSFVSPRDSQTIDDRFLPVQLMATARRPLSSVRFSMDGDEFTTVGWPIAGPIMIPNRFPRGFHTLTARVADDVGNAASAYITINLTAEAGPLGIEWRAPYAYASLWSGSFPVDIRFSVDDIKSIRTLRVVARERGSGEETHIGTIDAPPLPSLSFQWSAMPANGGTYDIVVQATLGSGEVREAALPVTVVR